jgi:hypothetical protein
MAFPTFLRAVVVDVIADPVLYKASSEGNSLLSEILDAAGVRDVNDLPRNTIIARLARTEYIEDAEPIDQIFFPFFSSHMSLPVKPMEHVWVMFENPNEVDITSRKGFWLTRIHESRTIEDVNYTHSERSLLPKKSVKKLTAAQKAGAKPQEGLSIPSNNSGNDTHTNSGALEDTTGTGYLEIALKSFAETTTKHETVPRFTKGPGDLVMQGSNNTLISLGNARSNVVDISMSSANIINPTANVVAPSGEIDIVAGRGQSVLTGVETVVNDFGNNETHKKINSSENKIEGDPDYELDKARIVVSSLRDPDSLFNIRFEHDTPSPADAENELSASEISAGRTRESANTLSAERSLVAAKADTIRLVARQNIKITVQNQANPDNSCGITITADGDVIIIPGQEGFIKLGGSDADRALLCSALPADTAAGKTIEHPVLTDGNALIGAERDQARLEFKEDHCAFASKILVKGN